MNLSQTKEEFPSKSAQYKSTLPLFLYGYSLGGIFNSAYVIWEHQAQVKSMGGEV